ncbi:core-2/I-Branching enzyme [Glaciihabitans tibetensis]|uniref:Peptide O-xylosyltransferase n=1 Tax=Glaciihabitans tibetensis TaxID=1266600 RepID=A0A2T0V394_9MICO|nr:beta-1,6-N-acetylglucosaminyltransferase [Glaciihabitans tibetensis]PRY64659.1 core-2/I-Branching enzyme [Glaciihabitans tibetensis]
MIAFLILAHTDPVHLRRLVHALQPHDVFVHVDAKTNMDSSWDGIDATFVENRVPVYWAGFSMVEATKLLLRASLDKGIEYERLVLISGSCYPIKPMAELSALFAQDPELNYIRYVSMENAGHLPTLIDRRYFRDGILPANLTARYEPLRRLERFTRKVIETAARPLRHPRLRHFTPFHGSAYWAITRECASWVMDVVDSPFGKELDGYYRRVFASDEQYFHSIVGNSPFASNATGIMPYEGRGTYRAANLHLIDPTLAKWFEISDLERISESKKYFVRKVRTGDSTTLLDTIDESF